MTNGAAWGALVLRVVLGIVFVMRGYAALAIVGPSAVAGYTIRMGFPPGIAPLLVWYLVLVHTIGGALIAVGLWTRVAAVLNIPIMLCAVLLLHWPQGFYLTGVIVDAPAGRTSVAGYEYALLVLACVVAVALTGPGPFSIDSKRHAPGRRH
jgi:putative oxidoreductase